MSAKRAKSNTAFFIFVGVIAAAILAGSALLTVGTRTDGGSATPIPTQTGVYPQLFSDNLDRQVTLDIEPLRIVSLAPSYTEIIYALGSGDRIVGRDDLSTFPSQAIEKPSLTKENRTAEKIKALDPDIVLLGPADKALAAELDKAKIANLYFEEPANYRAMISRIYLISRLINKREFANTIVSPLETKLAALGEALKDIRHGEGMKSYIELGMPNETASVATMPGDLLYQLHTTNIFEQSAEKQFVAKSEEVISKNPDVIFLTNPADNLETLKGRPGWSEISAVKNGKVYNVDPIKVVYGSPRSIEELERIAKLLYPDKVR